MSEQQTPVLAKAEAPAAPVQPGPTPPGAPLKKKRRKRNIRSIITAIVLLIALAVSGYFLWKNVLSDPPEDKGDVLTDFAYRGSISSMVQGSGVARAKSTETITLTASGTVQEVYVAEGDQVTQGDPLYAIYSEAAHQAVTDAEKNISSLQEEKAGLFKDRADLQKERADLVEERQEIEKDIDKLTVRAPFSGKLVQVEDLHKDNNLSANTKVAVLVNDKKLRLSLYYSYAYENDIKTGQSAQVSIPAVMGSFPGTVEAINKVSFITPEGSKCFEVVVVMDNPETLTEGMDASVALTAADGTAIYPYQNGQLKYYETREITTALDGPVVESRLLNYADVTEGQALVIQGDKEVQKRIKDKEDEIAAKDEQIAAKDEQIAAKDEQIVDAQKKLADAQKALGDFNAVASISGTVMSCSLVAGEDVESGKVAVSIADTAIMTVTIDVDERNISGIQTGMTIDLSDWDGNIFMGIVDAVSLEPKSENGITTYSVSVRVDNPDGAMRSGQSLDYSFAANESLDCIVVPGICVRYISDIEGNNISVVYLKADSAPDNAIELSPEVQKDVPEGFYAVPVEVGLSDNSTVEIKSGLNEGDEVFTNYNKEQADSW
ncbi:HlyD family efflux transporter periplasmic adaptor subunit [Pseudoflavonifractor sp. 524-17]|uniref:efflux RND transporter periplasmic adaptor subunit n=1 Tax=Pseudoflavonifractor sp. 524-17 TaxID=2304577 RepID=UPI0013797BF8|nr:efflux RND transporter periplasmic adaptor subunit [Pseudoflavonifractor sp. 524-17]NCE65297.1 HlyD family efflux transporter periplasmic adaptor subunit [Pseudoflavonifractor sp. 524-17]